MMLASSPLVSVVIVNYNRRDDLRIALRSVEAQDYPRFEIVVVDNDSKDGSREMIANEFPRVRLIARSENLGMGGYSVGIHGSAGEYIFQMDNDAEMPDRDLLSRVVEEFARAGSDLGVIATRVEDVLSGETADELRARDSRRGPIKAGGFHSGGVAFRREAIIAAGCYNREVFLYGSELFVQMELLARGYVIRYFPELLVLHRRSGVSRSKDFLYFTQRNRYWWMQRFATRWQRARYLPSMLVYDAAHCIWARVPGTFVRSIRDGLAALPPSLQPQVRSNNSDFLANIRFVGRRFGLAALARHAVAKLGGRD